MYIIYLETHAHTQTRTCNRKKSLNVDIITTFTLRCIRDGRTSFRVLYLQNCPLQDFAPEDIFYLRVENYLEQISKKLNQKSFSIRIFRDSLLEVGDRKYKEKDKTCCEKMLSKTKREFS